jgi:hypothetical protein
MQPAYSCSPEARPQASRPVWAQVLRRAPQHLREHLLATLREEARDCDLDWRALAAALFWKTLQGGPSRLGEMSVSRNV